MKSAYQFIIAGLAVDERKAARVILWRRERLPLPLAYLTRTELADFLENGLRLAECVKDDLLEAAKQLASRMLPQLPQQQENEKNKQSAHQKKHDELEEKSINNLVNHLGTERHYWARLEIPFKRFLDNLAAEWEVITQADET